MEQDMALLEQWKPKEATCIECGGTFEKRSTARRSQWCPDCKSKKDKNARDARDFSRKMTVEKKGEGRLCECCCQRFGQVTHHVKPLAKGGAVDTENLLFVCHQCHRDLHKEVGFSSGHH